MNKNWNINVDYGSQKIELFEDFACGIRKLATLKQGWFKTTKGSLISREQMQAMLIEWKKIAE
jgi:hypothetical protein